MDNLCGVINIYKEKDYTSHDVVAIVRKYLGYVKAGHTGTLDPAAEGVLPICIGKATKISERLASEAKGYRAIIHLGVTTDTEDSTGTVLETKSVDCDTDAITEAVMSFKGEYFQTPPMYSAIKVKGKKLYELAREGIVIERKERLIHIYDIKILEFLPDHKVSIEVLCSKGTYIRSLCSDIGKKLGCGANMGELLRTQTGMFRLNKSIKLDELKKTVEENKLSSVLISVEDTLNGLKRVHATSHADKYLYNGNIINANFLKGHGKELNVGDEALVFDVNEKLVGIYSVSIATDQDEAKILIPTTMLLS